MGHTFVEGDLDIGFISWARRLALALKCLDRHEMRHGSVNRGQNYFKYALISGIGLAR